jgi:queuine tRNA-ribosyltransferase subunit QTRTD1
MTTTEETKTKLILHCENGSPPYLTPALLASCFPSTSRAVQDHLIFGIAVRDSCVTPVYEPKGRKSKKKTKQTNNSGKSTPPSRQGSAASDGASSIASTSSAKPTGYTFTGRPLHEHLIIPREYNVLACPSFDLIDDGKSSNNATKAATATHRGLSLVTPRGHQKLTPDLYHEVARKMEAPVSIGMYDQASEENSKRNAKSVERTKLWLEEWSNISAEQNNDDEDKSTSCEIWAPIVGGADLELRLDCIENATKQSSICGVALIGIHHIADRQARVELMQSCTKAIPKSMPYAVLVANSIGQILDAAQNGVQFIGSSLPVLLARSHRALVLDLHAWKDEEKGVLNDDDLAKKRPRAVGGAISIDDPNTTKDGCICLDEKSFARDVASFVKGCSCLACTEHKRAYVHHLINAKELLAEILLFVHNLHHLLSLLQEMNDATATGRQVEFVKHIERQLRLQ